MRIQNHVDICMVLYHHLTYYCHTDKQHTLLSSLAAHYSATQ